MYQMALVVLTLPSPFKLFAEVDGSSHMGYPQSLLASPYQVPLSVINPDLTRQTILPIYRLSGKNAGALSRSRVLPPSG
jgi:hypothetical protein